MEGVNARVVCICGSFRFQAEMDAVCEEFASQGIKCLMPVRKSDVSRGVLGCFQRIEMAEAVVVVNPGGYIGHSVLLDMGYAFAKRKPIHLLVMHPDPAVMTLVSSVLTSSPPNE